MNPVRNIDSESVSNDFVVSFLNNNKISCFYRVSNGVNKRIKSIIEAKPTARLAEASGVAQARLAEASGVARARLAEASGVARVVPVSLNKELFFLNF